MRSRRYAALGLLALALGLDEGCLGLSQQRPAVRNRGGSVPGAVAEVVVPPPPVPLPAQTAQGLETASVTPTPASSPTLAVQASATRTPQPVVVAVAPPPAPPALAAPPPVDAAAKLGELYRLAVESYASINGYTAQLRRREQVNGQDKPEELLFFKFRKQPYSVYFKWIGPAARGREVVYVKGRHDNQIHTLLADGDMWPLPGGKPIALAPDNPFVLSKSRYAITQAGIGFLIEQFGQALQPRDPARAPAVKYLGLVKRPEFATPLEMIEQAIPPGVEPQLPSGGQRLEGFDPASHLPILLITHDRAGHEAEYYCYGSLQTVVALTDDDFDPEKLWHSKR